MSVRFLIAQFDGARTAKARLMRQACLEKAIELETMLRATVGSYEPGSCPEAALDLLEDVISHLGCSSEDEISVDEAVERDAAAPLP